MADSSPITPPQRAAPRRRWLWPLVAALVGIVMGVLAATLVPLVLDGRPIPLPLEASGRVAGKGKGPIELAGKATTTLKAFSLKDHEGYTVLTLGLARLHADLDAIAKNLVHAPGGRVEHVGLYLRRGKSGKVSLGEVLGKDGEGKPGGGPALDIGPLDISDIRLTIAFSDNPVILQIDRASVRVQRKAGEAKPKLFLSQIQGHLLKPDPLPQPIALRGGTGVVDLGGAPLVDMRVRGCIGDSEMRMHIEVAERRQGADITLDTTGALAKSAALALKLVSKFKPEKLRVDTGSVEVTEPGACDRAQGTELRARIDAESDAQD